MIITLTFFGQLRELVGCDEIDLELKQEIRLQELKQIVSERFPVLQTQMSVVSFAIDNEYMPADTLIQDSSRVALLPPICGG